MGHSAYLSELGSYANLTGSEARLKNADVPRRLMAVALAAIFLSSAPGAAAGPIPLAKKLSRALSVPHVAKSRTGAVAVDLTTGRAVYAHNLGLPLIPASNEKLAVTYACLLALGPSFRFSTDALGEGELDGSVWRGDIFLKGYGDPMLSTLDLLKLASQLHSQGIRRVSGQIVGDESFFDATPRRAGLEAVVLHERVGAALGADGRPRPLPRSHHARAGARGGAVLPRGAHSRRHLRRREGDDRNGPRDGRPAGFDRVRAARADPPLHGPRERQLHRRDPPQAARGRLRRAGHHGRRGRGRAPAPRPSRGFRSPACASWTARVCRGSTG